MIGIYKITNLKNNKVYIGQSVDIERRWRVHKTSSLNYPLYNDFKKYGIENFSFEVLVECKKEKLNELELYFIKKYNSNKKAFGYNQSLSSSVYGHSTIFDDVIIKNLFNDLLECKLTKKQLAQKYHCSERTIRDINNGKCWYQENIQYPIRKFFIGKDGKKYLNYKSLLGEKKCIFCGKKISKQSKMCRNCLYQYQRKVERPSKEQLEILIKENTFAALGKMYNVSGNTIKKWCKSYNIYNKYGDVSPTV